MKQKLINVLKIQTTSGNQWRMFAYIIRQVKQLGCTYYVKKGNIYVTKGETDLYPCVVAHMDTVHKIGKDLTVVEVGNNLTGFNAATMEQTGIGGDDKVGVFIALECLSKFDCIKAAFFRDEEIGCHGSYEADTTFFGDCGFVLQCDRKGYGDFITKAGGVKLCGKRFRKDVNHIINSYGYKFESGMMTDVMALKELGIECAMANISCGYYNPHTEKEYVNVPDVSDCLDMVCDIIMALKGQYYATPYTAPTFTYKPYKSVQPAKFDRYNFMEDKSWNDNKGWSDDTFYPDYPVATKTKQLCECCQEKAKLTYIYEYKMELCDKCIKDYIKPYDA